MTNTKKTSKPESKASKKVSKEKMVLSPAEQKRRMKQIMNNKFVTCPEVECNFTYLPFPMQLGCFEDRLAALCPVCDKTTIAQLKEYVKECEELNTKISPVEVANILDGETEDLDSYESEEFESFDSMNLSFDELGFFEDEAA